MSFGRLPRPGPVWRWLVWILYVLAWTKALLTPIPAPATEVLGPHPLLAFLFNKSLHVAAYLVLSILSAWLHVPRRWRWLLLVFMSLHAVGTEYGQQFVATRHPSWRDVGLDHLGICLGVALSSKWWRASD